MLRALWQKNGISSNLECAHPLSGTAAPVSWASFPVRYGEDDYGRIVCSKYDVEGEPPENRPAELGIEHWKSVRSDSDHVDRSIQFIQKPNCGSNASFGVPGRGLAGVLLRRRVEANRPSHQPLNRLRS